MVCLEVKLLKLLATQPLQAPIRRNPAVPVNKLQLDFQTSYCSRVLVFRFVSMDIQREPDPKGDWVQVVLSGKYLSYKTYYFYFWPLRQNQVRFQICRLTRQI